MNASDEERLNSWIVEIVEALVDGVQWRQEGDERRAIGLGGFSVNTRSGAWYSHTHGTGSYSTIPLIKLLKSCGYPEAQSWAETWLKAHPGTGAGIIANGDDIAIEHAAIAKHVIDQLIDPVGTMVQTHVQQTRGIPITDFSKLPVKFLPHARTGESAVAALMTSHGRVVATELTYLDPYGNKSQVLPNRRRFNLEKAPDAVFELPAQEGVADMLANTAITEGLPDFLSVASLGRPWRLVGLPGIGTLRHLPVKRGERVIVIRDGDDLGSAGHNALIAGIDHLILEGAVVRVTETPLGADANSILQAEGHPGLLALINTASALAELSDDGEITRLSRLDRLEYERQRKGQAEKLGIRVGALDDVVKKKRGEHLTDADVIEIPGQGRPVIIPVVEPWPHPVNGAELLNEISTKIREYMVLEPHQGEAAGLFAVFTHAFDAFEIAPKLVCKSAQKRSGKTRQLDVLSRLVAKAIGAAGITAAALLRLIEHYCPTLLLDEFDTMVKGNPELAETLRGVLNSGFNRSSAHMIKSVPVPPNGWEERLFSTWCPQVLAGIGMIPDTIADRSIIIEMKRKLRKEKVKRLRAKDGEDLRILARKAARWAEDHKIELAAVDPDTPEQLDDRAADAWAPLLAIADAASPEWGRRARITAILLSGSRDHEDTVETELLADIRTLFGQKTKTLSSDQLVAGLCLLEGHPWADINRGHPLTKHSLARCGRSTLAPAPSSLAVAAERQPLRGTNWNSFRTPSNDTFRRPPHFRPIKPSNR
jgi:putative DNA primase/helicase